MTVKDARAAAMAQTRAELIEECRRNAQGNWDQWASQLGAFREDVRAKIRAARPYSPQASGSFEARAEVLEGKGGFPLFESKPEHYLRYIVEPESLDEFRKARTVPLVASWLKRQGIDFIFVPVPKMTEIFPEYFSDHCPQDRIVAVAMRKFILELLGEDIEVIDLLPDLMAERDSAPAPLYLSADPHWSPRGKQVGARRIAERLKRYDFAAKALTASPVYKAVEAPFCPFNQSVLWPALTPAQRQRAEPAWPLTEPLITDLKGGVFASPTSPILFTGDSYNWQTVDMVGRELNLPPSILCGGGQVTQTFKNMLRDPEILHGRKVVIWLMCNSNLVIKWPLPPGLRTALEATQ